MESRLETIEVDPRGCDLVPGRNECRPRVNFTHRRGKQIRGERLKRLNRFAGDAAGVINASARP